MLRKLSYNFGIGLEALFQNRMRALLTSLGIIFGVASVIAMLAIGRGAEQEILTKMETLGANNLIIQPIIEQEEGDTEEEDPEVEAQSQRFTPGLTLQDAMSLEMLPYVKGVSPEIEVESIAIRNGRKRSVKLVGINNAYFKNGTFQLAEGAIFTSEHQEYARPVCIIGSSVRSRFFPTEEPIGKQIKVGNLWLTVIGVMQARNISREIRDELGIRNYDLDIYLPIETMLLRFKNRALVTQSLIQQANMEDDDDPEKPKANYHQLNRVILQVEEGKYMYSLAEICNRMLSRRHNQVIDFEIIVPELLLKQKQETTDMFNFVLFAIASIALIVGGIGIMNIMLASVLERIKEIGLRLSLGATQRDIILQFMSEAVAISISGGILGIILGISLSAIIGQFTGIETIVSIDSIVLSFFVAVSVGLIFGIYPAQKAARQDPVISLRSN